MAESLTQAEVLARLAEQDSVERLTQRMPTDLGPMQTALPVEESVLDQVQRAVAEQLGGGREDYRRAEKLLTAAEFLPGLGDLSDAAAVSEAAERGDLIGVGIAGLGLLPGIGGMVRRGGDELRSKGRQTLYHATDKDFTEFKKMPSRKSQQYGRGTYLTPSKDVANIAALDLTYSQPKELRSSYQPPVAEGARVIPVTIGDLKLADKKDYNLALAQAQARVGMKGLGSRERSFKVREVADDILELEKGFEGKILGRPGGPPEIIVYDPKNIRFALDVEETPVELPPKDSPSMSMQMEFPGMDTRLALPEDPAKDLLARRDGLRGALETDEFRGSRAKVGRELAQIERKIKELRAAAGYPTDRDYAQGGEVNQMRKPVISSGLSGLLRGFTQGPLARVSRETQEPVGMFRGGGTGRFVPELDFRNVQIDPTQLPAYVAPAAAEALAAQQAAQATSAAAPAMPTTQELIAEQRALEQAQRTGNLPTTPGSFLTEGADVLLQPAVITDYQGRGGTRPVDLGLETAPGQTPDEPGMLGGTVATVDTTPVDTAPVDTTPVQTTPVETTPVATTPVTTTSVTTTPVASEPVQTVATDPVYLPPVETTPVVAGPSAAEVLAAEQAAADALAAQEAEQIRIAQEEAARVAAEQEAIRIANEQAAAELLAQQEAARIAQEQAAAEEAQRLAAETLAAQQAAEEAERIRLAEEEAQRIAAEQAAAEAAAAQALADEQAALEALAQRQAAEEAAALAAEQEALAAAEAERIAAAQLAAEQLAAQEAAQLAAEQEAAAQLQAAEQLAAQQEADRIAMEAQIAATPDPDPIYDAPTQGELLQAAETAQAATEPLFTTPTDTATAIDRGAYGQVFDPVGGGIGSLQAALDRINLTVPDPVENFAFGYPTSQGMEIQRTYMPFEGTEEERATGYTMPIYKPVAQQTMPSLFRTTETGDVDPDAFTAGSAAPGPGSGIINTGTQSTAPGTYGLEPTQMYQCPNGYVLSFVNGNPICNRVGGGGPGKKRQVPPEVIDITGVGGMRYGGDVGLSRGIGSFGA